MTERFTGDARVDPDAPEPTADGDRQWDVLAAVATGGVIGAEARYALAAAVPHGPATFPWSTVVTNALGCLLIGVLMTVIAGLPRPHRLLRPMVGVGVLGGFTTFSTFSVDTERLVQAHRPLMALGYVACTLALSALAVLCGSSCAQAIHRRRSSRGPASC